MKQLFSILIAVVGWFAIVTQFILMMNNRTESIEETIIRFFSFFTILTNLFVAAYLSSQALRGGQFGVFRPGLLTGLTVCITIVGLVYQLILRGTWHPQGLQRLVDELLHSVIPALTIIFWYLYEEKRKVRYRQMFSWAIYPLLYLGFILLRGHFAHFYPYPFVDVDVLGIWRVTMNSFFVLLLFIVLSLAFIRVGKAFAKSARV